MMYRPAAPFASRVHEGGHDRPGERKQGQRKDGAAQHTGRNGLDPLGPHRAHRPPKARDKIPALRMMPNSTKATAAE
ncbi:MAG: hypothetical protein M3461_19745 [Pseudomonadota bacterium]|nr:hypothetical protein [Pseudomonadota bacterium]